MSPTKELSAIIFDIQRCSLSDGPGIRTDIFFKGCPLRCDWCHNPESQAASAVLAYNPQLCRHCGACVQACPNGAHTISATNATSGTVGVMLHAIDRTKCTGIGECVKVCCYGALELVGELYTVDELAKEIQIDLPYYAIGEGGGITYTGGEPMLQVEFIEACIDRFPGVHMCVETSGYAPSESFLKILPKIDLFLFDYKLTDVAKHEYYCGVGNELILQNLHLLHEQGADIVLRLPIIPTVNDDEGHFRAVASLMRRYPRIQYAEIMPFHSLGEGKLERFGLSPRMHQYPVPTPQEVEGWRTRLKALGVLDIRIS